VCEQPYTPFVWANESESNIKCSTSGGAWTTVPKNLIYIGKRKKLFNAWGHCGSCADGAVEFEADVNVWEFKHPNPFFGEYSTKDYDRHYITENSKNNRYIGDNIVFETKDEYDIWLKTFRGVKFKGFWPNQMVVFCYKRVEKLLAEDIYNALDLPIDTRLCNGIIEVKVLYDDVLHMVTEFRCTNDGGKLRKKDVKPYILARQTMFDTNGDISNVDD
jgi:hypothetical protein